MFKSKRCPRCEGKISKDFEFCPHCGNKLKDSEDYGFLGKNDFSEDLKLPFGLNMMLKPLMKELTKQMAELDRELKEGEKKNKSANFSIHFSTPGQKPIKLQGIQIPRNTSLPVKKVLTLPKFSDKSLKKFSTLEREEPKTNVRRLADRIIYELDLLGVDSLERVNIEKFENSWEVRVVGEKAYLKEIEIDLPLVSYGLEDEKLVLEFSAK